MLYTVITLLLYPSEAIYFTVYWSCMEWYFIAKFTVVFVFFDKKVVNHTNLDLVCNFDLKKCFYQETMHVYAGCLQTHTVHQGNTSPQHLQLFLVHLYPQTHVSRGGSRVLEEGGAHSESIIRT